MGGCEQQPGANDSPGRKLHVSNFLSEVANSWKAGMMVLSLTEFHGSRLYNTEPVVGVQKHQETNKSSAVVMKN